MAANKCPRCKRVFQTLDDEYGEHDCPYCGLRPEDVYEPLLIESNGGDDDDDEEHTTQATG